MNTKTYKGYEDLIAVLQEALEQSAFGKGRARHGQDKPWVEQPIITIQEMLGNEGFSLGQAIKKCQEATRLPPEKAVEELKGAIVYLAAAIYLIRNRHFGPPKNVEWAKDAQQQLFPWLEELRPPGENN